MLKGRRYCTHSFQSNEGSCAILRGTQQKDGVVYTIVLSYILGSAVDYVLFVFLCNI